MVTRGDVMCWCLLGAQVHSEGVEYISGKHMVAKHDLKTCLCVMLTNIEGGRHGGGGGRLRKFE